MKRRAIFSAVVLAALTAGVAVTSCGGDRNSVSSHVRDRKAYSLGQEHAARIIGMRDDEPALQDALLDVRARMTNINARLGAQAAADYERGFVDYITEKDDSLAKVLF